MKTIRGKMRDQVQQLGSSLILRKGDIVALEIPSNLPKELQITHWFARPLYRKDWPKTMPF